MRYKNSYFKFLQPNKLNLILLAVLCSPQQLLADQHLEENKRSEVKDSGLLPFKILPKIIFSNSEAISSKTYQPSNSLLKENNKSNFSSQITNANAYYFAAKNVSGRANDYLRANGNVEFRYQDKVVIADIIDYTAVSDLLKAEGDIRFIGNEGEIAGKSLQYSVASGKGVFNSANYQYLPVLPNKISNNSITKSPSSHGVATQINSEKSAEITNSSNITERYAYADKIEFAGDGRYQLFSGFMTSCRPDRVDWYLKADKIKLDYQLDRGSSENNTLYFKDLPIISVPKFWFPLSSNTRHSGFLAPTFAITSTARENNSNQAGLDITMPYYWNIAPNYDFTFLPRIMQSRGLQLGGLYRYLQSNYNGEIKAEWLPKDQVAKISRSALKIVHQQKIIENLNAEFIWHEVSDNTYFTDLTSKISDTTQKNLPRSIKFTYNPNSWWDASALIQRYQTLKPNPNVSTVELYRLAPEININAKKYNVFGFDFQFAAQSSNYLHSTKVDGQRNAITAEASYQFEQPAYFIKPALKVQATDYRLNQHSSINDKNQQYIIPIYTIDSGIFLEKNSSFFSDDFLQTLEPRLFYSYIPYVNQQNAPIFDSAYSDFNFAQIFVANRFSGKDRIGDANQLTAALSSRILSKTNGSEYLHAAIGARYGFTKSRVVLNNELVTTQGSTNILAALTSKILPKTILDAAVEYDPNNKYTQRMSIGGRYLPAPGKILNFSYRLQKNTLKQLDLSAQWLLTNQWSVLSRFNYSIRDKLSLESLLGFEYQAGCWAARLVAHRLQTAAGKPSVNYFFQIELGDLGRIGSSPIQLLNRSINGYQAQGNYRRKEIEENNQVSIFSDEDKLSSDLAW